jgi:predicted  nucleic acid-binding Zn-ribbon protein
MTHACCPSCRLRFTPAAAVHFDGCPGCGEPPHQASSEEVLGLRLMTVDATAESFPDAIAVAVALPVDDGDLTRC